MDAVLNPVTIAHHLRTAAENYSATAADFARKGAACEREAAASIGKAREDLLAKAENHQRLAACFERQRETSLEWAESLEAADRLTVNDEEFIVAHVTEAQLYRVRSGR